MTTDKEALKPLGTWTDGTTTMVYPPFGARVENPKEVFKVRGKKDGHQFDNIILCPGSGMWCGVENIEDILQCSAKAMREMQCRAEAAEQREAALRDAAGESERRLGLEKTLHQSRARVSEARGQYIETLAKRLVEVGIKLPDRPEDSIKMPRLATLGIGESK